VGVFFVGVTGNLQGTNRDRGVFGVKLARRVELHLIGWICCGR